MVIRVGRPWIYMIDLSVSRVVEGNTVSPDGGFLDRGHRRDGTLMAFGDKPHVGICEGVQPSGKEYPRVVALYSLALSLAVVSVDFDGPAGLTALARSGRKS